MTALHWDYPATGPLTLSANVTAFPPTQALLDGRVTSGAVTLDFAGLDKAHSGFKDMLRRGRFDLSEMAIATFLQAHAYGKPFTLLPFVVLGRLQHHCIGYNTDVHQTLAPADLAGKTVGVRSYTQTTGLWVRGILQNDYEVDPDTVRWLCFDPPHVAEYTDPPSVIWGDPADDPVDMLLAGKLDAAILGMNMPKDSRIHPLIPDPHRAALDWHAREGLVPPNHYLIVPDALCDQRPDAVAELCRMLTQARSMAAQPEGPDPWPVGIAANRAALECAARFAWQQHMIDRLPRVADLFHPLVQELVP